MTDQQARAVIEALLGVLDALGRIEARLDAMTRDPSSPEAKVVNVYDLARPDDT